MELSHTTPSGNVNMVDVSPKKEQLRTARAYGFIKLSPGTITLIREDAMKKGNVLLTAEIAAIQGAKRCSELIPLCHNIVIDKVEATLNITEEGVEVRTMARSVGRTGVEMEALTAASVALLTVYDMCKAVDKGMVITSVRLLEKTKEDINIETK